MPLSFDINALRGQLERLQTALLNPSIDEDALAARLREARAGLPLPVLWLLGKTQAGKSSIVQALTGSPRAEIGNGFAPCTRSASVYEYPPQAPVLRFLDTRGLGELDYDPGEDIAYCEAQAHLVVAVMKAADPNQQAVFEVLRTVRRRHPEWPLLMAQTGLHELYPPGAGHLQPYPFGADGSALPASLPADLRRALVAQREALGRIDGLHPPRWVALDLTLPEDGYAPTDYGLSALWAAIEALSPLGLEAQLRGDAGVRELYARAAHQQIVGYSLSAAGLGALPVVDLVAVSSVQAKMVHGLARLYGQALDKRAVSEFIGLLGSGIASGLVSRMLGKSLVKLIPGWGQTIGAVWGASVSGATTFALGKAAAYVFASRQAGRPLEPARLREIYAEAYAEGRQMLRRQLGRT